MSSGSTIRPWATRPEARRPYTGPGELGQGFGGAGDDEHGVGLAGQVHVQDVALGSPEVVLRVGLLPCEGLKGQGGDEASGRGREQGDDSRPFLGQHGGQGRGFERGDGTRDTQQQGTLVQWGTHGLPSGIQDVYNRAK